MTELSAELRDDLEAAGATSRFVDVPHGNLHVLDFGGSGPDVLVLPGITSPAISWEFVVRRIDGGARFVVADLRGRGLSDAPADGAYDLDAYAEDAAAVIAGLALERPIVLGHSLGARIAAALAVRHPEAVGSLILVDPPLSGPGRAPYPTSREAFLAQLHEAQAGTTADAVGAYWPTWPRRELELRARWLPTCDETAVAATHAGFESEDFLTWWRRLATPAVLVRGGRSPVVDDAGAAELAAERPDIPTMVVPDAAHMIPWDDLDGFVGVTRELLGRLPAGGDA
jgi:N-formylmaleamate deformylase